MKYLDLAGLSTTVNAVKAWASEQFGAVTLSWESVLAAYAAAEGDSMTSYCTREKLIELYNGIANGKRIIFRSTSWSNSFCVPNAGWVYMSGNMYVIGFGIFDTFGTNQMLSVDIELATSGTGTILQSKIVRVIA